METLIIQVPPLAEDRQGVTENWISKPSAQLGAGLQPGDAGGNQSALGTRGLRPRGLQGVLSSSLTHPFLQQRAHGLGCFGPRSFTLAESWDASVPWETPAPRETLPRDSSRSSGAARKLLLPGHWGARVGGYGEASGCSAQPGRQPQFDPVHPGTG